ncbi:MAG: hypothetical protein HYX80_02195 [Chloroflexi bacterium]|nr:hypothetical protein [Chloroflexota bacterium]
MATQIASEVWKVTTQEAYQEHLKKLRGEIETRNKKPVEQLFQEKRQRLWDAMTMKEPDRVPVILGSTFFPAKYAGLPYSSAYYDPIRWKAAYTQFIADFEPDTWGSAIAQSGPALDILEAKNILWPGGTLPPDVPQQNVDDEYMKEDEYDYFLEDFADFYLRRYLPRVYGALEPISRMPSLGDRGGGTGFQALLNAFTTEEYAKIGLAMKRAGLEQAKFRNAIGNLTNDMAGLGLPPLSDGLGGGPGGPAFDQIANTYRGWKGVITDMYRRPDKLIAAMEKLTNSGMARLTPADPTRKGPQFSGGGPIHRGSDRFLSKKQWETFYWPTWKKSMMKSIELGYMVNIFAEGFCEGRFEYFLELPKGKVMIRFTDTNMFKAKEVLGNHCALMGSVPLTLLQMGSPSEVDEYCKKLIQVCGKGGGYILRSDTDFIQEAKPENVKAMVDSVRKYRP